MCLKRIRYIPLVYHEHKKVKQRKEDREYNEKKLTELCCMFLENLCPTAEKKTKKKIICTSKDMNKIY